MINNTLQPVTPDPVESTKLSLNINDQVFIKRLFDRQDDVIKEYISDTYDKHAALICQSLAEVIHAQNDRMFDALNKQNKLILEIKDDIKNIMLRIDKIELSLDGKEARIVALEKYASWPNTIIRMIVAVTTGIGIGYFLHNKF